MKKALAVLTLCLANVCLVAQQPAAQLPNYFEVCHVKTSSSAEVRDCLAEIDRKNKEDEKTADKKSEAGWEKIREAEALKRTIDDANQLRSKSTATKINGATDSVKNLNSQINNNPASQAVTDKSLSIVNQLAQRELEILDNVQSNIQIVSEPPGSSSASFNAGQRHQMVEKSSLSLDRQFEVQARALQAASPSRERTGRTPVVQNRSVDQQFSNQAANIMASPSTVRAVAVRQRAILAVEEAKRQRQAAEEAARLKAIEKAEQAEAAANRRAQRYTVPVPAQSPPEEDYSRENNSYCADPPCSVR